MTAVFFVGCFATGCLLSFILFQTDRSASFKAGWDEGYTAGVHEAYERVRAARRRERAEQ